MDLGQDLGRRRLNEIHGHQAINASGEVGSVVPPKAMCAQNGFCPLGPWWRAA
jgi:hypothetical protein